MAHAYEFEILITLRICYLIYDFCYICVFIPQYKNFIFKILYKIQFFDAIIFEVKFLWSFIEFFY